MLTDTQKLWYAQDLRRYLARMRAEWDAGKRFPRVNAEISGGELHIGSYTYETPDMLEDLLQPIRYTHKRVEYRSGYYKDYYCEDPIFRVKYPMYCYMTPEEYWKRTFNKMWDRVINVEKEAHEDMLARKEAENRQRAVMRIQQLAIMNDWEYFLTITFDDEKVNALNAKAVFEKLSNWLKNQTSRKGLKYLLVPELHKSGRIHAHALINGALKLEDSGTRMIRGFSKPVKLQTYYDLIQKKRVDPDRCRILRTVYNVPEWKNGFSTAIPTYGEPAALAHYIGKYITKDTERIFGRRYWFSRNIQYRAKEIMSDITPEHYAACPAKEYRGAGGRGPGIKIENHFTIKITKKEEKMLDQISMLAENVGQIWHEHDGEGVSL